MGSVGHKDDEFGHEFLEFEIRDGCMRYANDSGYRKAAPIRKEGMKLARWTCY